MSDLPVWYFPVCFFTFGLCFGSFLNVVALRGLSGEDMVFTRSKCPKCGNQLRWYMNIPLLSYIFLRGKCAFCKTHISCQYPVVEFLTALSFVLIYFAFGYNIKAIFLCVISFFFILLALTDILERVILDYHAYILAVIGLLYAGFGYSDITLIQSIIGGICGFIIFEILSRIGIFLANVRMFGEGDSLIILALGAIFGIKTLLILVGISFIVQTVCALPVLIINSFKDKNHMLALTYLFLVFAVGYIVAVNCFDMFKNYNIYLISVGVLSLLLLFALKIIMGEVRRKRELFDKTDDIDTIIEKTSFHIMPFGPALIISAYICLFFIDKIKDLIYQFIY